MGLPWGMPFSNLRHFIRLLETRSDLKRIQESVSPNLEIAAITDQITKAGGPALFFEKVDGSDLPVVINLFGSPQRMAWALGINHLDELGDRLRNLLDVKLGNGLIGLAANFPKLRNLTSLPPRLVRKGPVQERVFRNDAVDLRRLPVLTCWPGDGGPFVTLPLVITRDPLDGEVNVGMYRMQIFDRNTTGMHWQRHKTGARHLENARKAGKKLEVAVALGGDPALIYAATAPLPPVPGLNEFALTGYLRGKSVELTRAVTVDLDVPAQAEIILEGYVDPEEAWQAEGPFGDHTGFYTLQDLYPLFHVTAITMRQDAIYPATIVGKPPMEDAYFIEASEKLFKIPAQLILPEIVDYHMPPAGIAHNLVNVRINKQYPGQAFKVANGLLGLGQMMFAKVILVTDEKVAPQNHLEFWRAVLKNVTPGRHQQYAKGPIDVLDHSSRSWSYGSKIILDGTRKHREEGLNQEWEPNSTRTYQELPEHNEILDQYQLAGGFWFITIHKSRAGQGHQIGEWAANQPEAEGVKIIAVLDDLTDPTNFEDCIWTLLNNIDPERDIKVVEESPLTPVFLIDGTPKIQAEGFTREWPEKIMMAPEIIDRVSPLVKTILQEDVPL